MINIVVTDTDIEIGFSVQNGSLNCFTKLNLTVDSIEILDDNGWKILGLIQYTSLLNYDIDTTVNATYYCRVNTTLGSQNLSISVPSMLSDYENAEVTTQHASSMIIVTKPITPPEFPVIQVAASGAAVLALLLIILLLTCTIFLR